MQTIQTALEQRGDVTALALVELTFEPLWRSRFTRYSAELLNAVLYDLIGAVAPEFGRALHTENVNPFSVTALWDAKHGLAVSQVRQRQPLTARVGVLAPEMLAALEPALREGPVRLGYTLADAVVLPLEQQPFELTNSRLVELRPELPPLLSYAELHEQATAADEIVLEFVSPTVFRHRSQTVLHAEPTDAPARNARARGKPFWTLQPFQDVEAVLQRRVFPFYLDRWQKLSAHPLAGVTEAQLIEQVRLVHSAVTILSFPYRGTQETGLLGWAGYRVEGGAELRQAVAALADFAAFSGTGSRTAMGRGQTRRRV